LEYRVLKGDKVVPLSAGNPGYKPSPKTHLRADALLSSFEQAFHRHLSARDYGLVSLTGSILIFRPFFFRPKSSHGVSEELQYWELLAKADSKRRAVFVHFADDLKRWREYWVSNKAERETAVMTRKIRKILAKTGLSQDKIAATLKHENSFLGSSKVLGADEARILSENSKADKEAAEEWDFEQLSLAGCGKTSISQSRSIY